MTENIIEVKNLTRKFGDLIAVDNIDLDIRKGEIFSLLGHNGAGKTTTIRMLSCLLKPSSGKATINENDIYSDYLKIKQIIGISPQETAIADRLNVRENLMLIGGIYGLNKAESKKRTEELIELFDLKDRTKEQVRKFSGGMKRKLSIAMAMMPDPEILFLDEPTIGLDPQARKSLWKYIESLKKNKTILLTTHYLEEADSLADRIAIMDKGKIVALGTPSELKKQVVKTETMEIIADVSDEVITELKDKFNSVETTNEGIIIKNETIDFNEVVEIFASKSVKIKSLSMKEASLDDVFLKLLNK